MNLKEQRKAKFRLNEFGLIFRLYAAGIDGKVLSFLRNYLSNRTQKVVLPGGSSNILPVRAGVPQGVSIRSIDVLVYI